jgi:hypothetical protein
MSQAKWFMTVVQIISPDSFATRLRHPSELMNLYSRLFYAFSVNGLEEPLEENQHPDDHSHHSHQIMAKDGKLKLRFHPFQIVSVMLFI